MLKQAWRSYLSSINPRNIKKETIKGQFFQILFWLLIYPNLIIHDLEMKEAIWISVFRFVPFFLLVWSNENSPFLMSKAMFLVPLKEHERTAYVKAGLVIKTVVSVTLAFVIEMILSIFYGMDFVEICVMLLIQFTYAIALHISFANPKGKEQTSSQMHWVNQIVIIFGVLLVYAYSILDIGAEAILALICKILIGIAVVGYIIFDYLVIKNRFDTAVALADNYELTFQIEGKVEKQEKLSISSK